MVKWSSWTWRVFLTMSCRKNNNSCVMVQTVLENVPECFLFFSPFIILFFHPFMFYVMVLNVSLLALLKHNFAQSKQLTTKSHHLRCNVLCNNSSITDWWQWWPWLLFQERGSTVAGTGVLFWWKKKLEKTCMQEFTSIWVISQNYQWEN